MQALYKGEVAEVWQISETGPQPDWVQQAFAENYLVWLDHHVRILMSGIHPSLTKNLQTSAVGTIGGGFSGYAMYELGYPGDYLDVTNHRVVSAGKFAKQYHPLA